MRGSTKRRKGFTLIEILVVMAIIITIAAIMYPVLIQAKDTAKMKTCASNLRQMGAAFRQYSDDNNGYALPLTPDSYPNPWVVYVKPLVPYLGQKSTPLYGSQTALSVPGLKRMWICPGDISRGQTPSTWATSGASYLYPGPGGYVDAFGVWPPASGRSGVMKVRDPRKPEVWAKPSRDMLFADYMGSFHRGTTSGSSYGTGDIKAKNSNILMLDMHITTVPADEIIEDGKKLGKYLYFVLDYDNPFSKDYNPTLTMAKPYSTKN